MAGVEDLPVAKSTVFTAERLAEDVMAVSPENVLPPVTGNFLGLLVEKENAAVQIVGDDALFEIIENAFQIAGVGEKFFE